MKHDKEMTFAESVAALNKYYFEQLFKEEYAPETMTEEEKAELEIMKAARKKRKESKIDKKMRFG